jgi:ankyrin repeat protein
MNSLWELITPTTEMSFLVTEFSGFREHMAVVNDDIAALDAALASEDGDMNYYRGFEPEHTPLSLAIQLHRTRMVEHLISIGVDIELGVSGHLPVEIAAQCGNASIMAMLLNAGADFHPFLLHEESLCHFAARNPDDGVLAVLLAHNVTLNVRNEMRELPLHVAAENENEKVLMMLLAAGYNRKSLRKRVGDEGDGDTIVHRAAANRNEKVLAMVIAAGAQVTWKNEARERPIHVAAKNPNAEVIRLLIAASIAMHVLKRTDKKVIFNAFSNPNEEVLDALLAAGFQWDDDDLPHICDAAAKNTNESILRRVIERADVATLNRMLRTAAAGGTARSVSLLIEAGADVRMTHVCYAACSNEKNAGVMRVLIDAGAPFGAAEFEAAMENSNLDAVKAFLQAGIEFPLTHNLIRRAIFVGSDAIFSMLLSRMTDSRAVVAPNDQADCSWFNVSQKRLMVLFAHGADLNRRLIGISHVDSNSLATMVAAGVDMVQHDFPRLERDDGVWDERYAMLTVAGHPEFDDKVPWREQAWACNYIGELQLQLFRLRSFQVCVGLQSLRLPALISCEILSNMFGRLESTVAFHVVWAIVTTIKHKKSILLLLR